ncbi:MAG: V-type ATP synthase subunit I [Clostridia bacterium]
MKKITLIALRRNQGDILTVLQNIEAVEIVSTGEFMTDDKKLLSLESNYHRINNSINILKPYVEKEGFLTPKPEITKEHLKRSLTEAFPICESVENAKAVLDEIKLEIEKSEEKLAAFSPWAELPDNLENVAPTRSTICLTGIIGNKKLNFLDKIDAGFSIVPFNTKKSYIVAVCRTEKRESVETELKNLGFVESPLPKDAVGTAGANIADAKCALTLKRDEYLRAETKLKALVKNNKELLFAADAAKTECDRERARIELMLSESSFILEGWIRDYDENRVKRTIENVTDACFLEIRDPVENEIPPSVVKNNKFIAPFEAVTNLYARPDPFGIDATPIMVPFYILFFGMMTSDSGYGLVLFILGLLYIKFKKPNGVFGSIVWTIAWGGLFAVICGFLFGTVFGMSWNTVFYGVDEGPFPLLFDPLKQSMAMLYLCCGLGVVHMIVGIGTKAYMSVKRGDTATAIFDCVAWIFVLIGIVGVFLAGEYAAPFFILIVLGFLMILLFAGRAKKNLIARVGKGLGSLYDVTGYISDTLSYARVYALGLVTGAMGQVFNSLGAMLAGAFGSGAVGKILGIIAAMAVLILLHVFSLFINTLGTFAHTSRLQYVEFFGKFYEAGGREFKPLKYNTDHIRLKQ